MTMTPEQEDEARALRAISCLWRLLDAAKKSDDARLAAYRDLGGFDAEDLLEALRTGRQHPTLRKWQALRAGPAANRSPPGLHELNARRLVVLLRIALERGAGMGKDAARKYVEAQLKRYGEKIGLKPASSDALRRWERKQPPMGSEGETVIATALGRTGGDPELLSRYFLSLVEFERRPAPTVRIRVSWSDT